MPNKLDSNFPSKISIARVIDNLAVDRLQTEGSAKEEETGQREALLELQGVTRGEQGSCRVGRWSGTVIGRGGRWGRYVHKADPS